MGVHSDALEERKDIMQDVRTMVGSGASDQHRAANAVSRFLDTSRPIDGLGKGDVGNALSDVGQGASSLAARGAYVGVIAIATDLFGPAGGIGVIAIDSKTGVLSDISGAIGGAVNSLFGAIMNMLGFDWTTSGETRNGGTWTNVQHPDGSDDYTENKGGLIVHDHSDGKGGFSETVDGNGYHSEYHQNNDGSTSFSATDSSGRTHTIDTTSEGGWSEGSSDGQGNTTVTSTDGQGNSTTFSTHTDPNTGEVTTTEVNTTTDPATGDKTTTTTVNNPDGTSETTTETTDKDGNPKGNGSMPAPDGNGEGDEGTSRLGPGSIGRPRPGHPSDVVINFGGSGGDDMGEGPVRLGDALRGIALLLNAAGGGDIPTAPDSGAEAEQDLRRKLKGLTLGEQRSGEDFINPKARARLIAGLAAAITAGRAV
jgi:hypothetical protein